MRSVIFMVVVLLVAFGSLAYFVYDFYPGESREFEVVNGSLIDRGGNEVILESDDFPEGMFFYENLRYVDSEISYVIDGSCGEDRAGDALEAFDIIESKTNLNFYRGGEGEIKVSCSENEEVPDEKHFIAGEGGPSEIVNTSRYNVVKEGLILLYSDSSCDRPIVAMHEIFHALGFKHSDNKNSIMYSVSNCNQVISDDMIRGLEELYVDDTLPDFVFEDIEAVKAGKYLSFIAKVRNVGLADSGGVGLGVYDGDKRILDYELGEIELGTGKILNVTNVRISRSVNELNFVIDYGGSIAEINEEDNELNLVVSD